jgi:hypothetical protein
LKIRKKDILVHLVSVRLVHVRLVFVFKLRGGSIPICNRASHFAQYTIEGSSVKVNNTKCLKKLNEETVMVFLIIKYIL